MMNLPITSNSVPPAANAANAAANGAADDAQVAAGAENANPFAALLARQIGGADSTQLNLAQISVGDDKGTSSQGTPDPAAIAAGAGTPVDAANSVMAMLLQIPQEARPVASQTSADGTAVSSTGTGGTSSAADNVSMLKGTGRGEGLGSRTQEAGGSPGLAAIRTDGIPADQKIATEALAKDMVKLEELPASLTAQAPANVAQAAPTALAAAMPNIQPGKAADNQQAISAPVGSSGWSDEFSQKISWMSTQKNQVAELHLNPPDLGPLDVVLKVSDNQATALFTSPHGAVREAVESALPKLREMLADNGITLGNATVSDQPPRDREAQGFMGQGSGAGSQRGESSGSARSEEISATTARPATVRSHNGMVDTFA